VIVYYVGTAIWIIGVLLFLGHVTRIFPTFAAAGYVTTLVGALIQFIGSAMLKNFNEKVQGKILAEADRQQAEVEDEKVNERSAYEIATGAHARQQAVEDDEDDDGEEDEAGDAEQRILCSECGFQYLAFVGRCPKCNPRR
jgi:hypothetical protein